MNAVSGPYAGRTGSKQTLQLDGTGSVSDSDYDRAETNPRRGTERNRSLTRKQGVVRWMQKKKVDVDCCNQHDPSPLHYSHISKNKDGGAIKRDREC